MKKYRRILVGLENKSTDRYLITYLIELIDYFGIQKIFFMHISRRSKHYNNPELNYVNQVIPGNKNNGILMINDLQRAFKDIDDIKCNFIIKDGNPEIEIPRIISEREIDLLILGRKPRPGMTHLLRQLTDTAKCSILIVPKIMRRKTSKGFAPVDFFSSPKQAINMAYYFKRLGLNKKISPYYHSSQLRKDKSIKEQSQHKGQNSSSRFKSIVPEDLIANCAIILSKRENLAKQIFDYSLNKGANLIMIGSRGSNQLASFLFGSIAMKLAEFSYRLPILIDKKRRVNNDTLEAFISL